jgi:LCP family protein required for cell wall assembly
MTPIRAALLSFLLPGLGQWAAGRWLRGLLFVAPLLGLVVLVGLGAAAPRTLLLGVIVRPEVLVALLVLDGLLFLQRVVAVVDAYRVAAAGRGCRSRARLPRLARLGSAAGLAVLVGASGVVHGGLGYLGARAYGTLDAVFVGDAGWAIPDFAASSPSPSPSAPSPSPEPSPIVSPSEPGGSSPSPLPSPSPSPSPSSSPSPALDWAADGRLDLLLIGSDAGPDRWSLRTDTLIVLSVDVATGRAALFGIPRNLVGVPLPAESAAAFPNGRFPGLLNALYVYAMGHPRFFPGGDSRGFRAVAGAVQELVGVRLDGAVVVNLAGFVRLVDAIGGLWIQVPSRLYDAFYPLEDGSGHIVLDIRPGCRHLDGRLALAYARSRHQDSDYGRMARQQAVLVALRRQLDPLELLPKLPELLDIAGQNLWTTLDPEEIAGLAELAGRVDAGAVRRVLFVPPTYPSQLDDRAIARIRRVVGGIFTSGDWPTSDELPSAANCPPQP